MFTAPNLASETIAHIGSFPLRNSMVMAWLAMAILIVAALVCKKKGFALVPRGFQNFVEFFIEGLFNFFNTVTNDKKQTRRFFPFVATIFIFIITSNWMGILPGVGSIGFYEEHHVEEKLGAESVSAHEGNAAEPGETEEKQKSATPIFVPYFRSAYADVNMTLAIAIISVIMTQVFGMMGLGFFHYLGKFFINPFKDPVGSGVGLLEIVSELSKMISFSFRLFGNIFAGEILLTVISFLAPYLAPIPFYGLEIFVGFVQALVFSLLTLVFMKMAVTSHHKEAHA